MGKYASDLQSGVVVAGNEISGTLHYVTDYTGFSGNVSEQSGNYLALKFETDDPEDVITVEVINGTVGHPVTLDSDRNIVIRLTDPRKQKLRVVTTHDGSSVTNMYYLHLLNLESE